MHGLRPASLSGSIFASPGARGFGINHLVSDYSPVPAPPVLLAVPNVSEGRDPEVIRAIGAAFAPARLLDTHSDPDHGRSVFTVAARRRS